MAASRVPGHFWPRYGVPRAKTWTGGNMFDWFECGYFFDLFSSNGRAKEPQKTRDQRLVNKKIHTYIHMPTCAYICLHTYMHTYVIIHTSFYRKYSIYTCNMYLCSNVCVWACVWLHVVCQWCLRLLPQDGAEGYVVNSTGEVRPWSRSAECSDGNAGRHVVAACQGPCYKVPWPAGNCPNWADSGRFWKFWKMNWCLRFT
jgi:hypothetical protein